VAIHIRRHGEPALLLADQLAATGQVAHQRGEPARHALEELRRRRGMPVLAAGRRRDPDDIGRGQHRGQFGRRHAAEEAHTVAEARRQAGLDLGAHILGREHAAQIQDGLGWIQALHDVEHEEAAPVATEAAHVDELQPRVGRQLCGGFRTAEALEPRVVGQYEAPLGPAPEGFHLVGYDDDDAVSEGGQAALGDGRQA